MLSPETIKAQVESLVPGAELVVVPNGSTDNPGALLVRGEQAVAVARALREHPALRLDYASNVTGVDWPDQVLREKHRIKLIVEGEEREFEEERERRVPGYLEVVYHLYSMALGHGPVVLRLRTGNRNDQVSLPSLTPVWRSCELQEREVFDLFGVRFEGHPDLRRLLMWEDYQDHPMRKDYSDPDDYEYEPTAHDRVLARSRARQGEGAAS
ncbi:MAG: NADH-quinone oxidoreductase subunit C [Verrucomicrobia bacterium]|nr:NADH-quinone oxidoreductase subunit C [Verrucomicrobiota bacterium]